MVERRVSRLFFHIDEAGNTGNNLFDENQPKLSYGMLSSPLNVDVLGRTLHLRMLRELGVDSLHANRLGMDALAHIAEPLLALQKKLQFGFDYYYIDKPSFVVVLLFDAIFDAGINPGVSWGWYWTPLRYPALWHLGKLLDENLAREAHRLCLTKNPNGHLDAIVSLLGELRERTRASHFHPRICEVFDDAFEYGIDHPSEMGFGCGDSKLVSPNAVAFQFISAALARRCRSLPRRRRDRNVGFIKVDRQQQFNAAQQTTHFYQGKLAEGLRMASGEQRQKMLNHPLFDGLESKDVQLRGLPPDKLEFAASAESIGLQLVDVYLWLIGRILEGDSVPGELVALARSIISRSVVDSISMEGMAERFRKFEARLPEMNGSDQ
jgi:hypothetical protein